MSDLDDDKQWFSAVVQDERFQSVLARINSEHVQEIESMSDEALQANAVPVLATYRGILKHERALIAFAAAPDFDFGKPVPETYPDEIEEINALKAGQDTEKQPPRPPKKPRTKRK